MTTFYYPSGLPFHHPEENHPELGYLPNGGSGEGYQFEFGLQHGLNLNSSLQYQLQEQSSCEIVNSNGYAIQVTPGQRKYGGPPLDWIGEIPGQECEVYCGKIPRGMLEHDLIPLFEQYGRIYEFRLMISTATYRAPQNRGFAFIKFTTEESALAAIAGLHDKAVCGSPGAGTRRLRVESCVNKVRLYVGNIPKAKSKEELFAEFGRRTKGLKEVIVYIPPEEKIKKNRGFCFLDYNSHFSAFVAKRHLTTTEVKFWGCDIVVDWADPVKEPEETIMSQVKVLFVRNLTMRVTEDRLQALFSTYGVVERVKRIKDYAFVHYQTREEAEKALEGLQGQEFCGTNLEITWGKPPGDKKHKEDTLRARERRMSEIAPTSFGYLSALQGAPASPAMNLNDSGYGCGYMDSPYMNFESQRATNAVPFYPQSPTSDHYYSQLEQLDASFFVNSARPSPQGDRLAGTAPNTAATRRQDRRSGAQSSRTIRRSNPGLQADANWRLNSGSAMTNQHYSNIHNAHGEPQLSPHTTISNGYNWRGRS